MHGAHVQCACIPGVSHYMYTYMHCHAQACQLAPIRERVDRPVWEGGGGSHTPVKTSFSKRGYLVFGPGHTRVQSSVSPKISVGVKLTPSNHRDTEVYRVDTVGLPLIILPLFPFISK